MGRPASFHTCLHGMFFISHLVSLEAICKEDETTGKKGWTRGVKLANSLRVSFDSACINLIIK